MEASGQSTETELAASESEAGLIDAPRTEQVSRITINALGLVCPAPIIRLARDAARMATGTEVELLTDDNAAIYDVPAWCRLRGVTYLGHTTAPGGSVTHLIRLGSVPETPDTAVRSADSA